MPVIDRTGQYRNDALLRRLVAEWTGQLSADADPPVILLEGGTRKRPARVFVRWSAWGNLTPQERSRLILDAAEEVLGLEASLDIVTPMGVTPQEAVDLKLVFA